MADDFKNQRDILAEQIGKRITDAIKLLRSRRDLEFASRLFYFVAGLLDAEARRRTSSLRLAPRGNRRRRFIRPPD